jgi:hypothetical protein
MTIFQIRIQTLKKLVGQVIDLIIIIVYCRLIVFFCYILTSFFDIVVLTFKTFIYIYIYICI